MAVVIETTLGDLTVDLFTEERPTTCMNFLKLCKMKYYNFCLFHSVQHNFIAQTGDPTGSGNGGESIFAKVQGKDSKFYEAEVMPKLKHYKPGLISMVNCGNNMLGSQFFLTLGADLQSLDSEHCIFGEVTEGFEVLQKLNEAICDTSHRPYQDIRIAHTVILEDPYDDPLGLQFPDGSPELSQDILKNGRIAPDEVIDETAGLSLAEVEEMQRAKEAAAQATILEIVGDLPDADVAPPENVLFVCKLNPVTNDDDLEVIFSRFGKVKSCEVIRDKKTGDSLQYAFVEFEDAKACEQAYFKMDNVLIDDRRIHVDFSQSVSKLKWKGKGRGVEHLDDKNVEKRDDGKKPYNSTSSRTELTSQNQVSGKASHNASHRSSSDSRRDRYSDRRRREHSSERERTSHSNSRRDHSKDHRRDRREDKQKRTEGRPGDSSRRGRVSPDGRDRRDRGRRHSEETEREQESLRSKHGDKKETESRYQEQYVAYEYKNYVRDDETQSERFSHEEKVNSSVKYHSHEHKNKNEYSPEHEGGNKISSNRSQPPEREPKSDKDRQLKDSESKEKKIVHADKSKERPVVSESAKVHKNEAKLADDSPIEKKQKPARSSESVKRDKDSDVSDESNKDDKGKGSNKTNKDKIVNDVRKKKKHEKIKRVKGTESDSSDDYKSRKKSDQGKNDRKSGSVKNKSRSSSMSVEKKIKRSSDPPHSKEKHKNKVLVRKKKKRKTYTSSSSEDSDTSSSSDSSSDSESDSSDSMQERKRKKRVKKPSVVVKKVKKKRKTKVAAKKRRRKKSSSESDSASSDDSHVKKKKAVRKKSSDSDSSSSDSSDSEVKRKRKRKQDSSDDERASKRTKIRKKKQHSKKRKASSSSEYSSSSSDSSSDSEEEKPNKKQGKRTEKKTKRVRK